MSLCIVSKLIVSTLLHPVSKSSMVMHTKNVFAGRSPYELAAASLIWADAARLQYHDRDVASF